MNRLGGRAAILLLAGTLLAPLAQAGTEAEGTFTAQGPIDIAGINGATVHPLAFLVPDASGLTSLTVTEARAVACLHEHHIMETDVAGQTIYTPVTMRDDCAERSNLRVETTARTTSEGWAGIFPNDSSTLNLALSSLQTDPRPVSSFATRGWRTASTEGSPPNHPSYAKRVTEPHLYLSVSGALTFQGDGLLKVLGPTVRVASREGTLDYETGQTTRERPGGRETVA